MNQDIQKITTFIAKHHVMSLATTNNAELSVCSLFYVYDADKFCFVVASSDATLHVKHVLQNSAVAGNILLETDEVGRIQGLQFRGMMQELHENALKKIYFN